MQGAGLQTGCRPSKGENEALVTHILSETGWDYIGQAKYKNSSPCGVQELLDGVADMLMATVEDFVFC